MNFYQLVPDDQDNSNWVIFDYRDSIGIRLQERFADLRCEVCGKIDEVTALKRGITSVNVQSRDDYILSSDGFILASTRFVSWIVRNSIHGVHAMSFDSLADYSIIWPTLLVPTDHDRMGIQIHGVCEKCGRIGETSFLPRLSSMVLPEARRCLFMSEVWSESRRGKRTWLTAPEETALLLQSSGLTGVTLRMLKP